MKTKKKSNFLLLLSEKKTNNGSIELPRGKFSVFPLKGDDEEEEEDWKETSARWWCN